MKFRDVNAVVAGLLRDVLAAPHSRLRRVEDQTERMRRAVATRGVHILAHPRGRIAGSLSRFCGFVSRSSFVSRQKPLPRISRGKSSVHGFGVFAAEPIAKNARIIDYAGELVRNDESCEAREERYLAEGCIWVFKVNRAWSRDAAVGGNIARFINHSCTPNCWFEVVDKTIWIRAGRAIRRGEELTYDYKTIGERTIPCRCRPGCPNRL